MGLERNKIINHLIENLKKALDDFIEIPFPDNNLVSNRLDEIHSKLVAYDSYTIGIIHKIANNDKSHKKFLEIDNHLYNELIDIKKKVAGIDEKEIVCKYIEYMNSLNALIDKANKIIDYTNK